MQTRPPVPHEARLRGGGGGRAALDPTAGIDTANDADTTIWHGGLDTAPIGGLDGAQVPAVALAKRAANWRTEEGYYV